MTTFYDVKLTPARLERAKRELKKALPDVQHAHRLEAFARGVGFISYADLQKHVQHWAERGKEPRTNAIDAEFNAYFKNSDVTLPTTTTLSDMVRKWPEAGQ